MQITDLPNNTSDRRSSFCLSNDKFFANLLKMQVLLSKFYENSGKDENLSAKRPTNKATCLESAIANLDNRIRLPFLLHHQGYSNLEISDMLQLPLGIVNSRICIAKKSLKAMFK